ncbi:DUF1858 domain-containing protein [Nitrosophilus alvini]|uniref:DUF1858 domain-containing protein n=1 Tax=Nitrosophilus alvini TaxID=2714855 RepID=UPI00190CBA04|nr:DUF1858 domain-containing protein [Nitrosophilus alvini]
MQIGFDTKVYDLLKEYPELEEKLIEINPKFKKLKNPVLRRTVAKIASLAQAAKIGGMDPVDLVNRLRAYVGQPPIDKAYEEKVQPSERPEWIKEIPFVEVDGSKLLDEGKNPLRELHKIIKNAQEGDIILLKTDFMPLPLIDTFKKEGHQVFAEEKGEECFTYIKKRAK